MGAVVGPGYSGCVFKRKKSTLEAEVVEPDDGPDGILGVVADLVEPAAKFASGGFVTDFVVDKVSELVTHAGEEKVEEIAKNPKKRRRLIWFVLLAAGAIGVGVMKSRSAKSAGSKPGSAGSTGGFQSSATSAASAKKTAAGADDASQASSGSASDAADATPRGLLSNASSASSAEKASGDDIERVEGIGPKIGAALRTAGIDTYAKLARASESDLKSAITDAGIKIVPTTDTWARQAALLRDGDEAGFIAYTDSLTAGREEG